LGETVELKKPFRVGIVGIKAPEISHLEMKGWVVFTDVGMLSSLSTRTRPLLKAKIALSSPVPSENISKRVHFFLPGISTE
jgi:hypothetical protein